MLRPEEVMSLMEMRFAAVGSPAMAELDREMTPILAELMTVEQKPWDINHPTAIKFFNWLVDKERTGEEFTYIIGPLKWHVIRIMSEHFKQYVEDDYSYGYVDMVAVEALAMKGLVLEDIWEQAGWILVKDHISFYGCDIVSSHCSSWILCAISDPALCPNPYLRFQMFVLLKMIDCDEPRVFELVLLALSTIDFDYVPLLESPFCYFQTLNLLTIMDTIWVFFEPGEIPLKLDEKLACQLIDAKAAGLSDIVYDVCYNSALNYSRYTQPKEVQGLVIILKSILKCTIYYKNAQKANISLAVPIILYGLLSEFKQTCQTPQLVELTADCIMHVLELSIIYSNCSMPSLSLGWMEKLMENLLHKNGVIRVDNSPAALEITLNNKKFLCKLRNLLERCPFYFLLPNISTLF